MANVPKKVVIIGLDCALPSLIEKHIADGHLPAFRRLIDAGVIADNCLVPYPTITPPNWASIATGAWPGTHGVTDFHMPVPGTTPNSHNVVQAFGSQRLKAETLWDAADKAGKKCIVLNYPGSWPSKMKNGIMVGGSGLSIGENRDGQPGMTGKDNFCNDQVITNGIYPSAIRGTFISANGWSNLPKKEQEQLELHAKITFRDAALKPAPTTWFVLARQSAGSGYDQVTLSPSRNFKDAFCTLTVGQWSPKITTKIDMADGKKQEVFFRCKLIDLSGDAESFRLYISAIGTTSGWCNPAEIASELQSEEGIVGHAGGIMGYATEWYEMDTFVEINELYTKYLGDIASALLTKHEWDLFFMHAHSPDWAYHMMLTSMVPDLTKDGSKLKEAWDAHLKIYQAQDRIVQQIMEACGDDTLFVLVSDHGAVPDGPVFDPYRILGQAGLMVLETKQAVDLIPATARGEGLITELKTMFQKPDAAKSKCFPQRTIYVYINLKGRDPEGTVEPSDYEKVQQQIIDALLTYVDPETGRRPISMALSKRDARILGLYGDGIGDVVYALYPWYSGQHGNILPAAEWGIGSLKALLTLTGPGIKKGHRLERTCNIVDLVPTICYLMDLPIPQQAEGGIIYQALRSPNFKAHEIDKLQAGLARMEIALQRRNRQPWDKKDDAP
jgi:predicted AlkP superfamily phosphohydrolase/phosphomutase